MVWPGFVSVLINFQQKTSYLRQIPIFHLNFTFKSRNYTYQSKKNRAKRILFLIITKNNLIREINYASMAVWCSEHWQSWFSFCDWDLKHTMQKILIFLLFLKGVKPKIKRTEIGFHVINGDLTKIFCTSYSDLWNIPILEFFPGFDLWDSRFRNVSYIL